MNQQKETVCNETGCPADITQPRPLSNCGNGILETGEECDINFPCIRGYCQHCRCLNVTQEDIVSNCTSRCLSLGYPTAYVLDDGNCTYPAGKNMNCSYMCSYRKVFPSAEEGKVCCCRDLKYVKCKEDSTGGGCICPSKEESSRICTDIKPNGTKWGG